MSERVEDLSIEYSEDGVLLVKQLDKEILTKGNWSTIMYLFQEWDKREEKYGPEKVSIRRYQKRNGVYRQQSKFNISNVKQAKEIIRVLDKWFHTAEEDSGVEAKTEEE